MPESVIWVPLYVNVTVMSWPTHPAYRVMLRTTLSRVKSHLLMQSFSVYHPLKVYPSLEGSEGAVMRVPPSLSATYICATVPSWLSKVTVSMYLAYSVVSAVRGVL